MRASTTRRRVAVRINWQRNRLEICSLTDSVRAGDLQVTRAEHTSQVVKGSEDIVHHAAIDPLRSADGG